MLYPYDLSETNKPDIMVVLDASHAEAFNRAARAATTAMGFMMQSQGMLGLLKSQQFYIVGPIDFKNNVVAGTAIDEFGDHLVLSDQRTTITELRNQMNGHIREALNDIMSATGTNSINLIFCSGGALVILAPAPYRIAVLRFEDASTVKDERQCVIANKASRIAYQTVWNMLDEYILKHRPPAEETIIRDVIDDPLPRISPGLSLINGGLSANPAAPLSRDEDEEDAIDRLTDEGEADDGEDLPGSSVASDTHAGEAEGAFDDFADMQF